MPLQQAPARLFGPWMGQCKAQYVCAIDNMLVFGDTSVADKWPALLVCNGNKEQTATEISPK